MKSYKSMLVNFVAKNSVAASALYELQIGDGAVSTRHAQLLICDNFLAGYRF